MVEVKDHTTGAITFKAVILQPQRVQVYYSTMQTAPTFSMEPQPSMVEMQALIF